MKSTSVPGERRENPRRSVKRVLRSTLIGLGLLTNATGKPPAEAELGALTAVDG
jgi:hypothetical protein